MLSTAMLSLSLTHVLNCSGSLFRDFWANFCYFARVAKYTEMLHKELSYIYSFVFYF